MNSILRYIFFTATSIVTLSGCVASNQKNVSISSPKPFHWSVENVHQPPIMMRQPERVSSYIINDLQAVKPQQLIGLFAKDIQNMFGVPDFKRYDLLVEIWQYRKKKCLVDIFLYQDKERSNVLRVKHAEARGRTVYNISQKQCFLEALRIKN